MRGIRGRLGTGGARQGVLVIAALVAAVLAGPASTEAALPPVSGGHDTVGAATPSTQWYFAEGYTGPGFQEYLTMANPTTATVNADVTFLFEGAVPLSRPVGIPPTSRVTVDVNAAAGTNREISIAVNASAPIVAERPMYFAAAVGAAGPVDGGHVVLGAPRTSTSWYFAEGFTGRGFQEYLTVQNPADASTTVHVRFSFPDGTVKQHDQGLRARSRATIDVDAVVGREREVSAVATSDGPTVVERPVYFARAVIGTAGGLAGYVDGGHVVIGADQPSPTWYFAEGYTGPGFQQYVTILNPAPTGAHVDAVFQLADGTTRSTALDLAPASRRTLDVNAFLGPGQESSLQLSATVPVVAERPMYFTFECFLQCLFKGGHNALGAPRARPTWLFAEGYTGRGGNNEFREYLTIQNPNPEPVTVPVTFLLASGATRSTTLTLRPTSRATIDARTVVGDNQEVSVQVGPASGPIVAERPMYFSTVPFNVYAEATAGKMSPAVDGMRQLVYVPNSESDTVDVIDPATFTVIDNFRVSRNPNHVSPSWDMQRIYVDNTVGNSLTPIDPRTGKVAGLDIPVADPYNLYFTPDGTRAIVVAERQQRLDFRDPHSFQLLESVSVPFAGVDHLDFSADGRELLASAEFSGWVVKVDVVGKRLTGQLQVGGSPIDVKLSPDGSVYYVANQVRGGVHIIDPGSMREIGFLPTGAGAHGMVVSRDTRSLYVTNRLGGSISVIDFASRSVVANWPIGGSPDMGAVSADGNTLWVSGRNHGQVYAVDTRSGALIRAIGVGRAPHGLTIFPQPGRYNLGHTGVTR